MFTQFVLFTETTLIKVIVSNVEEADNKGPKQNIEWVDLTVELGNKLHLTIT